MQQPSNATSSADDAATNSSTPAAAGYSMGQFSAKDPLGKVKELDEETPPGVVISPRTGKPKRRKANRACVHCQRTHLTCDNSRPCERCVQRGLAATCRDGTRKKAKYLQDVPDSLTPTATTDGSNKKRRSSSSSTKTSSTSNDTTANNNSMFHHPHSNSFSMASDSASRNDYFPLDNNNSHRRHSSNSSATGVAGRSNGAALDVTAVGGGPIQNNIYTQPPPPPPNPRHHSNPRGHHHHFQSTAINSEYRVLSNILTGVPAGSSLSSSSGGVSLQDVQQQQNNNNHMSPVQSEDSPLTDSSSVYNGTVYQSDILNHFTLGGSSDEKNLMDILATVDETYNPQSDTTTNRFQQQQPYPSVNHHRNTSIGPGGPKPPDWISETSGPKRPISFAITDYEPQPVEQPPGRVGVVADIAPFSSGTADWRTLKEPADIYAKIRKPYSYTPAYHALSEYLRSRFGTEDLMKMAKCMASYRPSFIACTNTLKEDDLIFMEQCFQRTLLEYEKFISYSGTPTIIWRRTGQITAVGKEFCILTGWSKQRLLGQRTFIVELMDDDSVLEYFQMFSNIAFGDSRGAMMSECTLLTPSGQKLKTSSMWTLKRDVFGIPMMIIGNFLPILA